MLVQVVQSHFNSKLGWKLGVQRHPKGSQQAALATGAPPLRKMQPLVSEHSHVQVVRNAPSFVCLLDNKHCFSSCVRFGSQQPLIIHKGAKVLRRTKINRGRKESTTNTDDLVEAVLNSVLGSSAVVIKMIFQRVRIAMVESLLSCVKTVKRWQNLHAVFFAAQKIL